jgi:hypothetical protein
MKYTLNNIDISPHVIGFTNVRYRVGKTRNLSPNSATITLANTDNLFSPENVNSYLYAYRRRYDQVTVKIETDDGVLVWHGVLDNVVRDIDGATVTLETTETISKITEQINIDYQAGDGFAGTMAHQGETEPATHQLAIARRYFDDSYLDVGAFLAAIEEQSADGITCEVTVTSDDTIKPLDLIKALCFDCYRLTIYNNRLSILKERVFDGNYGFYLPDELIIDSGIIQKQKYESYTRYAITCMNGTDIETYEGTIGDSGNGTADATTLTDAGASWDENELAGQFVEINDALILEITENTPTIIRFAGNTEIGAVTYKVLENNNLYSADYSTGKLVLTDGADEIGVAILSTQKAQRLIIRNIMVADSLPLLPGDTITIRYEDEGLIYKPFEIVELEHRPEERVYILDIEDLTIFDDTDTIEPPESVLDLEGIRQENTAKLWWTAITNATHYRIYQSTNGQDYHLVSTTTTASDTIEDLFRWIGYYFYVTAVNAYGMESGRSNILILAKQEDEAGYIDGSDGPNMEQYEKWGILEAYHFLICYKNLIGNDIGYLVKSEVAVLDKSQKQGASDISQTWAEDALSSTARTFGYIDTAGISTYSPYYKNTAGVISVINSLDIPLTLDGTTYAAGADLTDSDDWFIVDGLGDYMTYWFGTGYMADIMQTGWRDWFKVFHIDRTMGIFDSGTCSGTGTLTDATKTWNNDQWIGYYIKLGAEWYKITDNTANTITIDDATVFTDAAYIINSEPYSGFKGVFLDDVWDHIIINYTDIKDATDSNVTSDWAGATWVTDTSKSWTVNEWAGYQVQIAGAGPWFNITDNTADTINFDGPNGNVGAGKAYAIKCKFEVDNGVTYAEAMTDFLAEIRAHVETRSIEYEGSTARLAQGVIMLNTWPIDFANYQDFVDAINLNYHHYVMFEALQCTWIMANEVTKQFKINDWHQALDRYDQMKLTNVRLATLGYPPHQQMYLAHLAAGMLLSKYSDKIEDIISGSNIVLDQIFYDMLMARGLETKFTVGIPDSGYEDSYNAANYDHYAVHWRKFTGAYVYFNPARKVRKLEVIPTEELISYHTGDARENGTAYDLYLPPWSMEALFRPTMAGRIAALFLSEYHPYTYIDCNAAWVIFTAAGAAAIGTSSVWINNGHGHHKKFIIDGTATIPEGEPSQLFHAGDGAATSVTGYDADTEAIVGTGINSAVTLTSKTIYAVPFVEITGGAALVPGTDYLVEYKESENNAIDKGIWETDIYFLTDQTGVNLTVYFYEQGLGGDGYPDPDYERVEHGILYREATGFELITGDIDYADCGTTLEEGTDYFLIPEIIRWKWEYRIKNPFSIVGAMTGDPPAINTRNIISSDTPGVRKIQWGDVDADNVILVDAAHTSATSYNGKKLSYGSKTVTKPKVLIYGFTKDPRDASYATKAVADRTFNKWRTENLIDREDGVLYDDVVITGYYDGIEDPVDTGAWGSIQGWMDAESKTYAEAQAYFDVVIILDNFLEASAGSASTREQWSSWLDEVDYNFLSGFKSTESQNKLIIDVRFGGTGFVYYGGVQAIGTSLRNWSTGADLTDLYGVLYFASAAFSDLTDTDADIYADEDGTKLSTTLLTDYRIFNSIKNITDHYAVPVPTDPEEETSWPYYNTYENGGDSFSYIPRSALIRSGYAQATIFEHSKLYRRLYDITDSSEEWISYEPIELDTLYLRHMPVWILHRDLNFGAPLSVFQDDTGNRETIEAIYGWSYTGQMVAVPLIKRDQDLGAAFIEGKYFTYPEAIDEDSDRKLTDDFQTYTEWSGYFGHYISNFGSYAGYIGVWLRPQKDYHFYPLGGPNLYPYYRATDVNALLDLGNVIEFDHWSGEISPGYGKVYDGSYMDHGPIPFKRTKSVYEGNVLSIQKSTDVITIATNIESADLQNVNPATALAQGIITDVDEEPFAFGIYIYKVYIDLGFGYVADKNEFKGKYLFVFNRPYKIDGNTAGISIKLELWEDGDISDYDTWVTTVGYIRSNGSIHMCMLFNATEDENTIFNAPVVQVNPSSGTVIIYSARMVAAAAGPTPVGYIILYPNDENEENNKTNLGGLVTTLDIAQTIYVAGNDTDRWETSLIDRGLSIFDRHYQERIKEFACEYNTGLITGYAFTRIAEKAPLVVWAGVSVDDIKRLIFNFIGTTIQYTGVTITEGDKLYLYYNAMTDMLQILEQDVDDPIDCPYKYGSYEGMYLLALLATQSLNQFTWGVSSWGDGGRWA